MAYGYNNYGETIGTIFLKNKICRGCSHFLLKDYIVCTVRPIINGKQCPCATCLVKSMCTNTCLEFFQYQEADALVKTEELL